jgi:hypothetical protein
MRVRPLHPAWHPRRVFGICRVGRGRGNACPMMAINGASALNQFGMEVFQEGDQESLYQTITQPWLRINFFNEAQGETVLMR